MTEEFSEPLFLLLFHALGSRKLLKSNAYGVERTSEELMHWIQNRDAVTAESYGSTNLIFCSVKFLSGLILRKAKLS